MDDRDVYHDRQSRGRTKSGWLTSYHTFSFGTYQDPTRLGFRALRVVNEDYIIGGAGFPEHPHDHFEILTFVLSGQVSHRDSAGHTGVVPAGGLQLISSGRGVRHSEYNPAADEPVHLFQIWLHGEADAGEPRYQSLACAVPDSSPGHRLVASPAPTGGAEVLELRAPVFIWSGLLPARGGCTLRREPGRYAWLQILDGVLSVLRDDGTEELELRGGDGLQLGRLDAVRLEAQTDARYVWFDLA